MRLTGENNITHRTTLHNETLSITKFKWAGPGSNSRMLGRISAD